MSWPDVDEKAYPQMMQIEDGFRRRPIRMFARTIAFDLQTITIVR
jgi:hypothetical protein